MVYTALVAVDFCLFDAVLLGQHDLVRGCRSSVDCADVRSALHVTTAGAMGAGYKAVVVDDMDHGGVRSLLWYWWFARSDQEHQQQEHQLQQQLVRRSRIARHSATLQSVARHGRLATLVATSARTTTAQPFKKSSASFSASQGHSTWHTWYPRGTCDDFCSIRGLRQGWSYCLL